MDEILIPGLPMRSSRLALGTGDFGASVDESTAYALLDDYVAAGGNHLDTAHIYAAWIPGGWGASERMIGRWLRARGLEGRILVATKGAHMRLDGDQRGRVRPECIHADLRESLDRLGLDRVALYYLHRDDPDVPVDALLAALEAERRSGRIGAYACSNWSAPRLRAAAACARTHGWEGFRLNQVEWALASVPSEGWLGTRAMDDDLLAWHRASNIPVAAYTPQASGFFARDWNGHGGDGGKHARYLADPANLRRWRRVRDRAAAESISPTRLALAWLLAQPVPVLPVLGCKTRAHLRDSLGALSLRLKPSELEDLRRGAG